MYGRYDFENIKSVYLNQFLSAVHYLLLLKWMSDEILRNNNIAGAWIALNFIFEVKQLDANLRKT